MRRITIELLILVFLATTVHAQDAATVDVPVFKPGDSWTYQSHSQYHRNRTGKFKLTVTAVSEAGYKTSRTVLEGHMKSGNEHCTQQMNPTQQNGRKKRPFIPFFDFPLTPGKRWQGSWKYTKMKTKGKDRHFNATMKSHIEGWETVKTPAGEFRALKITYEAVHANEKRHSKVTKGIRWYCPEVRQIVRIEFKDKGGEAREEVRELIAYQPAP